MNVPCTPALHQQSSAKKVDKRRALKGISNISFVRAQERLVAANDKLSRVLKELHGKVSLDGPIRQAADAIIQELVDSSDDVFERFVIFSSKEEEDLRSAADSEEMTSTDIEQSIMKARRHIGARVLIGSESIAAAERLNVGIIEEEAEAPNPWVVVRCDPPWGASYQRAASRLHKLIAFEENVRRRRMGSHIHLVQKINAVVPMLTSTTTTSKMHTAANAPNPDAREGERRQINLSNESEKALALRDLLLRSQTRQTRVQQCLEAMAVRLKTNNYNRSLCDHELAAGTAQTSSKLKRRQTVSFAMETLSFSLGNWND
jgi:hypothetical protein